MVDDQHDAAVNPTITPGYEKLDGCVRVEDVGGWQIAVFGQNLLNEIYAYEINRVGYNFFEEGGRTYLFYAIAGEAGIAVQRCS